MKNLKKQENDMMDADASSPLEGDPFFSLPEDSEWNACIGSQGTEANYLDGYIEAAMELADAVIEKRMYEKRDTIAMPILYNARHSLELLLKFAVNRLHKTGMLKSSHPKNHDIMSHWALLHTSDLGDKVLQKYVGALEPFVTSLSKIDDDGQELRYPENRDGKKSLADRSLVNIEIMRVSLGKLNDAMEALKYRVLELISERGTGTYTPECSRRDLLEIARMLPPKSKWTEAEFNQVKGEVIKRFDLSGQKFSKALNVIKNNREMRRLIGLETPLIHLSDENAVFATEQWARRHPVQAADDNLGITIRSLEWEHIQEDRKIVREVNGAVAAKLALQLHFSPASESMGHHDSEVMDAGGFDRGDAGALGSIVAGGKEAYTVAFYAGARGSCCRSVS